MVRLFEGMDYRRKILQRVVSCEMFHGGMEQKDRERALYKFSNGSCNVFVSTDLAPNLTQVYPTDLVLACTSENIEDVCKTVAWLGEDIVVTGGACVCFST